MSLQVHVLYTHCSTSVINFAFQVSLKSVPEVLSYMVANLVSCDLDLHFCIYTVVPLPMLHIKFGFDWPSGLTVSEKIFENVNGRMDGHRLDCHPISSLCESSAQLS